MSKKWGTYQFLPGFLNKIWNGILALFVWRTYTVLRAGSGVSSRFLAYRSDLDRVYSPEVAGKWAVIPRPFTTPFVAVKNGKEDCEFAVFYEEQGMPRGCTVLTRGTRAEVIQAIWILAAVGFSVKDGDRIQEPLGFDVRKIITFV